MRKAQRIGGGAMQELKSLVLGDEKIATACKQFSISKSEYLDTANEIFTDWELQQTPPNEITAAHFYNVMRIKTTNQRQQQPRQRTESVTTDPKRRPFEALHHDPSEYYEPF